MNSGAKTAALHIASNVVGTKNSFDILLTGTGQTVYEAWAITNGVSTDPAALGGTNLLRFAFGVTPGCPKAELTTALCI